MTVTITVNDLAVALRITTDATDPPPAPYSGLLPRLLSATKSSIEAYAPDAPDDVQNEAAIRYVGWLMEAQLHGRSQQNAFTHSGARALLSQWHPVTHNNIRNVATW